MLKPESVVKSEIKVLTHIQSRFRLHFYELAKQKRDTSIKQKRINI